MSQRKSGKEMMKELSYFFNTCNSDEHQEFVESLSLEHRTIQQSILRALFGIMVEGAELFEKGRKDARNEASLKACKDMVDAYKEKYGCLPSQGLPII